MNKRLKSLLKMENFSSPFLNVFRIVFRLLLPVDRMYFKRNIRRHALSEMLQKPNCLTEPAFEKASFSNPFSQSRWGILSETHLKKNCFFESLLSIEMSYTERNASKIKRFDRWPIWKSFFSISILSIEMRYTEQNASKIKQFHKTRIWKKLLFLIPLVNRDELYWAKRFKNQTIWQNLYLNVKFSKGHLAYLKYKSKDTEKTMRRMKKW